MGVEESVERQLQQLRDVEAIKQLKARYFRLMDTNQWDELRALFTDDAQFDFTGDPDAMEGTDAVITRWSTYLTPAQTVHHGHMPEIELLGADKARGIWAMIDYVEWPPEDGRRRGIEGYGHYHEEYVKVDGEWKISLLRLTRLRVDGLPSSLDPDHFEP